MTTTPHRTGFAKILSVVFDSSSIFTKEATHLLNRAAAAAIKENSAHAGLAIQWGVPRIAVLERIQQRKERASKLFEHAQEAARLLDRHGGFGLEELKAAAERATYTELADLSVAILSLDWHNVDWDAMETAAAARTPPFSPGHSEKGFRDALVAEAFAQLVSSLPSDGMQHRAVLVTDDDLLAQAANARAAGDPRTFSASSLESLRTIIASLLSKIEEELIARLLPKATAVFFTPGAQSSLYYTERIPDRIAAELSSALEVRPPGADFRVNSSPSINPSQFVKTDEGRFVWANTIVFSSVAYRYQSGSLPSGYVYHSPAFPSGSADILGDFPSSDILSSGTYQIPIGPTAFSFPGASSVYGPPYSSDASPGVQFPVVVSTGRTVFEVRWSSQVGPDESLTSSKLDHIIYVDSEWS